MKTLEWFRTEITPRLLDYKLEYRSYKNGDFGDLEQVIIKSEKKEGSIDFWSLGWLGLELYDYEKDEHLVNILLEPEEECKEIFEKFLALLK